MYVEILVEIMIFGTMIPTPPKRSAEALSRRTLLWFVGEVRKPLRKIIRARSETLQGLMNLGLIPGQSARVGEIC